MPSTRQAWRMLIPCPTRDSITGKSLLGGVDDVTLAFGTLGAFGPADRSGPAQVRHELALQRSPRLDEEGQVDRLVGHPHSLIGREAGLQPAGDLLWRPVLSQLDCHQLAQGGIAGQLAALRSPRVI